MRQVVLDTETTGLEPEQGHRIIEVGCVELVNRRLTGRHFHQYLQPDRSIDEGAVAVHGITNEFLADKPRFADIVDGLMEFIRGSELVIHNAPFDVGFIDSELARLGDPWQGLEAYARVLDTLTVARQLHPGQKNSLDALCRRYGVDNAHRELHGALLDAEILADIYLCMTGGQTNLSLDDYGAGDGARGPGALTRIDPNRPSLPVVRAMAAELDSHASCLESIRQASGRCLWDDAEEESAGAGTSS